MKKLKKNILISSILVTLFMARTNAQQTSNESFCSDPVQRICGDTSIQRHERKSYINKLKKEISHEAKINSRPRIAKMKKSISSIHIFKRMAQSSLIRNEEILASVKRHIVNFESTIISVDNISKIKSYMYQAIDNSEIGLEIKDDFKKIIQSVIVGNFNDFLARESLEEGIFALQLENICGADGLSDNAFSTILRGDRYVLMCPGYLITLSQTASESDRFNNILHVISHEMGHHIDNKHYFTSNVYEPYLNCITKNFSKHLNRSAEDIKFCRFNSTSCDKKITASHSGELVADEWGIAVTALHAKAQNYSYIEADQLLTETWAKLCGAQDEGIHPNTEFRIEYLLRKNPEIANYLSCFNSEINPAPTCTFSGEK